MIGSSTMRPAGVRLKRGPIKYAAAAPPTSPPRCPALSTMDPGRKPMKAFRAHDSKTDVSEPRTFTPRAAKKSSFVFRKTANAPRRPKMHPLAPTLNGADRVRSEKTLPAIPAAAYTVAVPEGTRTDARCSTRQRHAWAGFGAPRGC